jgi:hypothetical protein
MIMQPPRGAARFLTGSTYAVLGFHPTIRREYTSDTNAVNTVPDQVGT